MEDNELLPLDNVITELSTLEAEVDTDVKEDFPLPDIITPDDTESGPDQAAVTPTILIAEEEERAESGTRGRSRTADAELKKCAAELNKVRT